MGVQTDFDMAKRKGNEDEQCAENWLRQQEHQDIQRPDSDPPDFVVDGRYAVEVTRLSQRITVGNSEHSKGVEEARIPLEDQLKKVLKELGPPGNRGKSWVVNCEYDFSEPSPDKRKRKEIAAQIRKALAPLTKPYDDNVISSMCSEHLDYRKHYGDTLLSRPHLCLECGICLGLREFSHDQPEFILQNVSDGYGMAIAPELNTSISNRIDAKSKKIRSQSKIEDYRDWWLVLVDHVCHLPMNRLSNHELSFVKDLKTDFWSRIVVVSSAGTGWHYDLLPASPESPSPQSKAMKPCVNDQSDMD